jgi:succinoglycan biosynthesis protein ExoA
MNQPTSTTDNPGDLPFVSLVMPIRNEAGFIARSLTAVMQQDYPADRFEILVSDGMSTDGTRAILEDLRTQHPQVVVLDNPGRIVSTGLNAALAHARGSIVVRVDGHCEIAPDYISRCVAHLLEDGVDGVGGPLHTIGTTPVGAAIATAMSSRFGVGGSAFRTTQAKTLLTDTIPFPAYTRAAIDRAGPYDEELVRNQDDEYNYRLRKLGAKLLLAADVRSQYFSRSTYRSLWRQYLQYGYYKVRVLQKHPAQMQPRHFAPLALLVLLLLSLALAPISALAGYIFLLVMGSYFTGIVAASIIVGVRGSWGLLLRLPLIFTILHLSYGLGFLGGLVYFWNRWGRYRQGRPRPGAATIAAEVVSG